MNPKQPQPLSHSFDTQASPDTTPPQAPAPKKGIAGPLILMFAPGILLIVTIALYAIINLISAPADTPASSGGDAAALFENETSPLQATFNSLLFVSGAVSILASLPCFIGGLIWLIRRKTTK